jgi:hypothetical protein
MPPPAVAAFDVALVGNTARVPVAPAGPQLAQPPLPSMMDPTMPATAASLWITVGNVTRVEVAVGPPRAGRRSISVAWQDAKVYVNREPEHHDITGERSAVA